MGAFIYDHTVRSGYHFKELFSLLSFFTMQPVSLIVRAQSVLGDP